MKSLRLPKFFLVPTVIFFLCASYFLGDSIISERSPDKKIQKIESLPTLKKFYGIDKKYYQLPLNLGDIDNKKGAYFSIAFDFKGGGKGIENLFQSAPLNDGIRVEIIGQTLSVIYPDPRVTTGYNYLILSNNINLEQEHHIKIEALTKQFLRISLDGESHAIYSSSLIFGTNLFLVGNGYSADRLYKGHISNIEFKATPYHSLVDSAIRRLPENLSQLYGSLALLGVLFILSACFLLRKFDFSALKILQIKPPQKVSISVLFFIQLVLAYISPLYRYSAAVYCYLFVIGLSYLQVFMPRFIEVKSYRWLFSPLVGLMMVTVVGSYFVTFGLSLPLLVISLPVVSTCVFIFQRIYQKKVNPLLSGDIEASLSAMLRILIVATFFVAPICLLIASPSYEDWFQNPTTPFRIGPDAAIYGYMAQYLLDGGSWLTAQSRVTEFGGLRVGEITKYTNLTMDWPFLFFYRWGLSIFQDLALIISGQSHIYTTLFSSLLIPYALLSGIVFYWLRERMGLNKVYAISGCLAFTLNVNLLNIWCEGFYGNLFSLPLYAILYLMIDTLAFSSEKKRSELFKTIAFLTLIFASILVSYGEGLLFVVPELLFIHGLINLILYRKIDYRLYVFLFTAIVCAILILFPCKFLLDWLIITLKQILEEGSNGYNQPQWALLDGIIGLKNIYRDISPTYGGNAYNYSLSELLITAINSVVLFSFLIWSAAKRSRWCTFGLSAYILTALFFLYVYKTSPKNNYAYMKMYIFLMPVLFVYFWGSVANFLMSIRSPKIRMGAENFAPLLSLVIVMNGLSYIAYYNQTSIQIDKKQIDSHNEFLKFDLKNSAFYLDAGRSLPYAMPAIMPATWITDNWNDLRLDDNKYLSKFLSRKLYIFIDKEDCVEYTYDHKNAVYEDLKFLIIDSGNLVDSLIYSGKFKVNKNQFKGIYTSQKSQSCSKSASN